MTLTLIKSPSLNAPTIHQLPTGITIIAEQVPVPAVNLNVWLNVGSASESDEINGMAHFLEHMVFKGTQRLESGEFEQLIEARGAITNAATSQEYTQYYITTAPQDFADLAPLQLDVIFNPSLPELAFERERLVVLEEIRRSEDNPNRRTFNRAIETSFQQLPYRRPILGSTEVIQGLQAEQMRNFHQQWYQPSAMTVAVAGNLAIKELIDIVTAGIEFNYRPSQEPSVRSIRSFKNLTPEPQFKEIVRSEYVDPNLQQARLIMMWRVPGMQELAETYSLDVLAVILGQGKVSRLFRDLREDRGLVFQISASNMTQKVQGIFYISAVLPTENIPEVEKAILEHIQDLQNEPVAASDIARIRTQVANRFILSNERPSDRTNIYGYYYSLLQDLEPAINYPHYIQQITAEDLQTAARRYLSTQAYGMVVMKPAAEQ